MNPIMYGIMAVLLVGTQTGYLRLARHLNLIDRPNERSSHTGYTTIRGGGILFVVAGLSAFVYSDFTDPYFFAGLVLVAVVSFMDDLRPLLRRYRIGAQFAGVALLLHQTGLTASELWVIGGLLIVGVGILNAWNFMDGINGMTAWYGLVCVGTLWYWQGQLRLPGINGLLPFAFVALFVFGYANARRQAICFAGDVGSISLAFIILLPLVELIVSTGTYLPVLLLAVYGVDTVLTILHRLYKRQNIVRAHRLHLFQLLVHTLNWPHRRVSGLYALIQLGINCMIIRATGWSVSAQWLMAGGVVVMLTGLYVLAKRRLT